MFDFGRKKMREDKLYCVKFVRRDDVRDEYYYHWKIEDAEDQFNFYKDDDPDYHVMYERIELILIIKKLSGVLDTIYF